jgi:hypothetical protein
VSLHQRSQTPVVVAGGRADLESERVGGVVKNQIDLVLALPPVVQAAAGVQGERLECCRRQVLPKSLSG